MASRVALREPLSRMSSTAAALSSPNGSGPRRSRAGGGVAKRSIASPFTGSEVDAPAVGAVEQGAAAERPELVGQRQPPAAGGGAADGLGGGGDLGVGHDVALLGVRGLR